MGISVAGTTVTFTPPAGATGLIGDFTDWYKRPALPTNGESIRLTLPRGAWVEYAWINAAGEAFADPDNSQKSLNPWWTYPRAVQVGDYPFHPLWEGQFWQSEASNIPKGKAERLAWEGQVFAGKRRGYVYTPPDYTPARTFPAYYIQDGVAFYRTGKLTDLLERALHQGLIESAVLVFVEPIERNEEYYLNDRYYQFLMTEVVPHIEAQYSVSREASGRGLWGASLGGLISLYTAWQHPETFGRVISHSGCFIANPAGRQGHHINTTTAGEWLREQLMSPPASPIASHGVQPNVTSLNISLDTGVLEWLCAPNRRMAATFKDLGVAHQYREYPSGHNWVSWKNALAEALLYMQGK